MQPKSRTPAQLFFGLLGALAVAGCRPTPPGPDTTPRPYAGTVLRVACPGDPDEAPAAVVRDYSRGWASRQGVRVEVVHYDARKGPGEVADADVWVLRPADLPRWAAADRLAPLPDSLTSRDNPYAWATLLPLYSEDLLRWDRTLYGLPLLGESPLCCYRSDLFADPGHRKAFAAKHPGRDPAAPSTWEEFADLAEYFRARGPSLPPLPADDDALAREFYTVAAGFARRAVPREEKRGAGHLDEVFAFYYDLDTGRPRIDSPGFVHALRLLRRLQACRPEGTSPTPQAAFRDGKAVLCLTDASWLPRFQQAPALHDHFGICRVPGGRVYFAFDTGKPHPVRESNHVPYLGSAGWVAVVPRDSARRDAAFALLAELTGPDTGNQIVLEPRWGGGPTREGQLRRERWDAFDLDPARTADLKEVLRQTLIHPRIKNPVIALRTPDTAAAQAVLARQIRAALTGKADAARALADVARGWKELEEKRGPEKHRKEYRISLGLRE